MEKTKSVLPQITSNYNKKLYIGFIFSLLLTILSISVLNTSIFEDSRVWYSTSTSSTLRKKANRIYGLNAHMWDGICLANVKEICKLPIFPKAPTLRVFAKSSKVIYPFTDIAVRLFGFIHPPLTGKYNFSVEISSHSAFALQLSTDEQPTNSRRLSRNSDQVELENGKKYFMDLLYTQGGNAVPNVALTWRKPGENTFVVIEENFLSVYLNDSELRTRKMHDPLIPETAVCKSTFALDVNQLNTYFEWEMAEYLPHNKVKDVLPTCEYNPSYNIHGRKVRYRWEGLNDLIQYTRWYPFPVINQNVTDPKGWYFALNETIVEEVAESYIKKLEERYPGKYKFISVKSIEQKADKKLGHRYLLELKILRKEDNRVLVLSEYVFKRKNDSSLCYPVGLQWNRTADIYIVVTSKNQGRWVQHFINNMARIYRETNDQHFHLVIFDYESQDIDVGEALKKSLLPRYTLIKKPGDFIKTKAYNEAVSSVKDPNAIIFLVDLHLEIASNLLDNIRKHCFKGRSAYIPILVRLRCGHFPDRPRGHWEGDGYGQVGVYKADWDRFGGFTNHRKGWGGEDWDLIDNVVEKELELERMRTPYIYHYYHNKKGMWHR